MPKKNNQTHHSRKRYADILAYAIIADAILILCSPILTTERHQAVADSLANLGPLPLLLATATILITIIIATGHNRWHGYLALNFKYPPISFSIILAPVFLGGLCWATADSPSLNAPWQFATDIATFTWNATDPTGWAITTVLGVAPIIFWLFSRYDGNKKVRRLDTAAQNDSDSFETIINDFDKLIKWVTDNDQPIENENSDLFGHNIVAKRIADRIIDQRENTNEHGAPTQALIGPFGSGKTSILRLVKARIEEHQAQRPKEKIEITDLSAWGYETSEALIAAILSALIRTLGKHTNTLTLVGLPSQYTHAIEKAAGRFAALTNLVQPPTNLNDRLKKIDNLAQAIELNITLWIEDLERFAGDGNLLSDPATKAAINNRLRPIRAFLYELNKLKNITVIIADTSLDTGFDLEKIARHIEHPPTLTPTLVWKVLRTFREGCLGGHPRDVIDPAHPSQRKIFTPPLAELELQMWVEQQTKVEPRSLALLLNSPRILKTCMRNTAEIWQGMPGELDFDELLVISAFRVSHPALFGFIDHELQPIRIGLATNPEHKENMKSHAFRRLHEILHNTKDDKEIQESLQALFDWLFPGRRIYRGNKKVDRRQPPRPQSVALQFKNIDYWQRYLGANSLISGEGDQQFLSGAKEWKLNTNPEFVSLLLHPHSADRILQFVTYFKKEEKCNLLEHLLDLVLSKPAVCEATSTSNALDTVAQMMAWMPPSEESLLRVLYPAIERAMKINLTIVDEIVTKFASSGGHYPRLLYGQPPIEFLEHLESHLLAVFTSSSKGAISKSLGDNSNPGLLWSLIIDDPRHPSAPSKTWGAIIEPLLLEAVIAPAIVLPQMISFVHRAVEILKTSKTETGSRSPGIVPRGAVDSEFIAQFGERLPDCISLLDSSVLQLDNKSRTKSQLEEIREFAATQRTKEKEV